MSTEKLLGILGSASGTAVTVATCKALYDKWNSRANERLEKEKAIEAAKQIDIAFSAELRAQSGLNFSQVVEMLRTTQDSLNAVTSELHTVQAQLQDTQSQLIDQQRQINTLATANNDLVKRNIELEKRCVTYLRQRERLTTKCSKMQAQISLLESKQSQ